MGETLSEEECARRAKNAEREGNVQDISDDDSDVEDLTQPKKKRRKMAGAGAAITKQNRRAAAVAAHLSTLKTDSDRILQRVLLHASLVPDEDARARRGAIGRRGCQEVAAHDCNGNLDQVLATAPPFDGRGLLLADVMGLGDGRVPARGAPTQGRRQGPRRRRRKSAHGSRRTTPCSRNGASTFSKASSTARRTCTSTAAALFAKRIKEPDASPRARRRTC